VDASVGRGTFGGVWPIENMINHGIFGVLGKKLQKMDGPMLTICT